MLKCFYIYFIDTNMEFSVQRQKKVPKYYEYKNYKLKLTPTVYPPHEDSEMLANCVYENSFGSHLDLGCGSGIAGFAALLNKKVEKVTFADIYEAPLETAKSNSLLLKHGKKTEFIKTDLFSNLKGKFDCISFNPPYLPTSKEEKIKGNLNKAFDGGEDGRLILEKFLESFEPHLKEKGKLLLLNSSLSNSIDYEDKNLDGNQETKLKLEKKGFKIKMFEERKFFFESLQILVCSKP